MADGRLGPSRSAASFLHSPGAKDHWLGLGHACCLPRMSPRSDLLQGAGTWLGSLGSGCAPARSPWLFARRGARGGRGPRQAERARGGELGEGVSHSRRARQVGPIGGCVGTVGPGWAGASEGATGPQQVAGGRPWKWRGTPHHPFSESSSTSGEELPRVLGFPVLGGGGDEPVGTLAPSEFSLERGRSTCSRLH